VSAPADTRQIVNDYLKDVMTRLRATFAHRLKEQRAEDPDVRLPCDTCAFRTNTDGMEGFDRTALGFLASLANPNGFFACHLPRKVNGDFFPRPRLDEEGGVVGFEPCAAFEVLTAEPPIDLRALVPEVDDIVAIFQGCKMPAWAGEETDTDG
jgi:hypothetical protein